MSDIVVQADDLSKQYRIGAVQQRHDTLRDQLAEGVKSLFSRKGIGRRRTDTIWALKDVSFEVKKGEVLGVIGRNGAGKSTLLKILSRITEPTAGRARLYGRVGALLEVGTGFHPDLTGRENIYLSGVLLGMRVSEVARKLDEIVAFAGVENFVETPVKRYSSGMYVRLAFAVAAHLEPEILIVDEVLAVGDLSFQAKCLGKMGEVAREGRTVLFVSHNMGAVSNLCTSAIWLDEGALVDRGAVAPIVRSYVKSASAVSHADTREWKRSGTGEARILEARLLDGTGDPCTTFSMGDTLVVEIDVDVYRPVRSLALSIEVKRTDMGIQVLQFNSKDQGFVVDEVRAGKRRFRAEIPNCPLYPALYQMTLWVGAMGAGLDYIADVLSFTMVQSDISRRTSSFSRHRAIFYHPARWEDVT